MNTTTLILVPALALSLGLCGCNGEASRSDYPDRSQETRAEADAIRMDGERREEIIERDLQQSLLALSFAEKQNAEKAKLERERIEIDRDRKIQPLEAQKAELESKAKRDCERIEQETESKISTVAGDEATRVKADAASRTAEIKRDLAVRIAEIEADIRDAKQAAQVRVANVNDGEAKEQADIAAKRTDAERKAREEKLKVKGDTTAKLDRLGKESSERRDDQRARDTEMRKSDDRITTQVRDSLVRHGESARGVTINTENGVVYLGGTVKNDTVRQQVAADTLKISGVSRVENRISIQ